MGKQYLVGASFWNERKDILIVSRCNLLNREWSTVDDDLKSNLFKGFGKENSLATRGTKTTCPKISDSYRRAFDEAETGWICFLMSFIFILF